MSQEQDIETLRKERGAQLRALVVSWDERRTFLDVLAEQQKQIDEGKFSPSEEWSVAADEILGYYMSRPKMTAWDEKSEPSPPQPKIIIP